MNERSRLHTARIRDETKCGLEGRRVERGELRAGSIERHEVLSHTPQMFLDSGLVVLDRFDEEEFPLDAEVSDPLRSRLQELQHSKEPRLAIAKVRFIPD